MLIVSLHFFERIRKLAKMRYTSQYTLLTIIIIITRQRPEVLFFRTCLGVSAGVETDRRIRVTAWFGVMAWFEKPIANDPTAHYRFGRGGVRWSTIALRTTLGSRANNLGRYCVKHGLPRKLLDETALQKHERAPHATGRVESRTWHAYTILPFSASNTMRLFEILKTKNTSWFRRKTVCSASKRQLKHRDAGDTRRDNWHGKILLV